MSEPFLKDNCFASDKKSLKHHEALFLMRERLKPCIGQETVETIESLGRVSAQNHCSKRQIPNCDNAAVDGYALDHSAIAPSKTQTLPLCMSVAAGAHTEIPALTPGSAARIFTGAVLPQGASTIVMQEDCIEDLASSNVTIPAGIKPDQNIRRAGEDTKIGDIILQKGQRIRPQDIARLASTGQHKLQCYKKLKIGLISSGNELLELQSEQMPLPGSVFNSNTPMLKAALHGLPVDIFDFGTMPDDLNILQNALAEAANQCDLLITTGAASKGAFDHFWQVINNLGHCHLRQIAIKPGRPMLMGQIGETPIMGLPGNPVSAFVCFCLYAYPAILYLCGANWRQPESYFLPSGFKITSKEIGRREFYRAWIENIDEGSVVRKFQQDGSGLISGLQAASGLVSVGENVDTVQIGMPVEFIPLSQFGFVT